MAYEMQIRGSQDRVKIRSPWAAALLPIITFGIYHLSVCRPRRGDHQGSVPEDLCWPGGDGVSITLR
jgi:hypothetical protein